MSSALSERQQFVLDLLRTRGPMSTTQVKRHVPIVGSSGRGGTVPATLRSLHRRDLVSREDGIWAAKKHVWRAKMEALSVR